MRRLLKIGLFFLPIFIIPLTINDIKINMRDARELLFESLVIIGLGLVIRNRWIRYFVFWAVLSWWFNYFLPPQSTAVLFNIALGFLLFYLIKDFIKINDIDGILKVICWTALFQVFWVGIQYLKIDPIFHYINPQGERIAGWHVNMVGWLGNSNILGAYLALCIPLFRVYYKKLLPLVFIGLLVSRSSTALASAVSGLIVFEFFTALQNKNYKRFVATISVSAGLLVFLVLNFDRFVYDRLELWKQMLTQTWGWRSLIGQGLGRFQTLRLVDATKTIWDNPHNEYLQIYFELGLVGIFFVFAYFTDLFRRFLRFRDEKAILLFSCVTVLLVNCVGNFPFQIAPTAFLGITYIALLEVLCHNHQNILSMN